MARDYTNLNMALQRGSIVKLNESRNCETRQEKIMATIEQLVFVGFNSRVVALDRETGQVVWQWRSPKGTGYTTVLLDGDRLIVSVMGYTYCLDPLTGEQLWFNELAGMGMGVASIASVWGSVQNLAGAAAAVAQRQSDAGGAGASA
jgi:outer membrane protein assembly factor BamB